MTVTGIAFSRIHKPRTLTKWHHLPHRSITVSMIRFHKPLASEILSLHLDNGHPPWTSFFVSYRSVVDDQWGRSHFNWTVSQGQNYHILRTGCYPYIKYHCTKRPYENLTFDDIFFRIIKILNLGIPCLAYGLSFYFYPRKHTEWISTASGLRVPIYFHYKENKGSSY